MASPDAIAATTDAIRALLDGAAKDSGTFTTVPVKIYQSDDLQQPLAAETPATVSVLLHVSGSPAQRNVPPRTRPLGERFRPPVPLDLLYLVSAWAGDPRMEQRLLGWAVRMLEDTPTPQRAAEPERLGGHVRPQRDGRTDVGASHATRGVRHLADRPDQSAAIRELGGPRGGDRVARSCTSKSWCRAPSSISHLAHLGCPRERVVVRADHAAAPIRTMA